MERDGNDLQGGWSCSSNGWLLSGFFLLFLRDVAAATSIMNVGPGEERRGAEEHRDLPLHVASIPPPPPPPREAVGGFSRCSRLGCAHHGDLVWADHNVPLTSTTSLPRRNLADAWKRKKERNPPSSHGYKGRNYKIKTRRLCRLRPILLLVRA